MARSIAISPVFEQSLKVAIPVQLGLVFFASLLLDGGNLLRCFGIAALAYCVGVAIIAIRRPHTPTRVDKFFLKFAPVFLMAISVVMGAIRNAIAYS